MSTKPLWNLCSWVGELNLTLFIESHESIWRRFASSTAKFAQSSASSRTIWSTSATVFSDWIIIERHLLQKDPLIESQFAGWSVLEEEKKIVRSGGWYSKKISTILFILLILWVLTLGAHFVCSLAHTKEKFLWIFLVSFIYYCHCLEERWSGKQFWSFVVDMWRMRLHFSWLSFSFSASMAWRVVEGVSIFL